MDQQQQFTSWLTLLTPKMKMYTAAVNDLIH